MKDILQGAVRWRYIIVLGLANVIGVAKMFIYAKVISVGEFGLYATLVLIGGLFTIGGSLGFNTELQRTLPIHFKHGDNRRVAIGLIQAVLVGHGVFLLCLPFTFLASGAASISPWMVMNALWGGLAQLMFGVITSETRSRQLLVRFSSEILARNLVTLLTGLTVIYYGGTSNLLYLSETAVNIAMTGFLFLRLLPVFEQFGFVKLLRESFEGIWRYTWAPVLSMQAIALLAFAIQNGERLLAKTFLTIEQFGVLSFGLIVSTVASAVQTILNSSIFVNQVMSFDEKGYWGLTRYSLKASFFALMLFSCLALPSFFIAKWLIESQFPDYASVIPWLPVILMAFVIRCSDFISNVFIISNKPNLVVQVQVAYIAIALAVTFVINETTLVNLNENGYYFVLNLASTFFPFVVLSIMALRGRTLEKSVS